MTTTKDIQGTQQHDDGGGKPNNIKNDGFIVKLAVVASMSGLLFGYDTVRTYVGGHGLFVCEREREREREREVIHGCGTKRLVKKAKTDWLCCLFEVLIPTSHHILFPH